MDLDDRCLVIRDILWEISNLYDFIDWMSMGKSPEEQPLIEQNKGAFFIWRSLTAMQIVHMDKLLDKKGKYSIQKVINLAKTNDRDLNFEWIERKLEIVVDSYKEFEMAFVRDKYIAHRDIVEKDISIDIHKFCIIKNGLNSVYNEFAKAMNLEEYQHEYAVVKCFQNVFGANSES